LVSTSITKGVVVFGPLGLRDVSGPARTIEIVFNDICGLHHFEKSKSKYGFRIAAYFSVVTPFIDLSSASAVPNDDLSGRGVRPVSGWRCSLSLPMTDWLVRHITVFGLTGQNWMVIAFPMVFVGIALAWWSRP
jgi:hypothetical protein